jgi:hypothetical protein
MRKCVSKCVTFSTSQARRKNLLPNKGRSRCSFVFILGVRESRRSGNNKAQ